jgi:hypothetical protein
MKLNWNNPKLGTTNATFSWSAEHAEDVHNGEVLLGGVRKPDRPWTTVVLGQVNVSELVAQQYRAINQGDDRKADISQAFEESMELLGENFKDAIENYFWDIPSTGEKLFKDAPNWETIDDSGELRQSQNLEFS